MKKFDLGSLKKYSPLLIGGAILGGVYWYFKSSDKPSASIALPLPVRAAPPPDLRGPRVRKGVASQTRSQLTISARSPGFLYAPIVKIEAGGYRSFIPPVNGIFTRRLLVTNGRYFAEIKAV